MFGIIIFRANLEALVRHLETSCNTVWSGFEAYPEKGKGKVKIKLAKRQDYECKKCTQKFSENCLEHTE